MLDVVIQLNVTVIPVNSETVRGNLSPAGRTVGWKPGEANLQAL